ncbi:hypothetical protein [Streptomyces sp. LNU-CPARS28]|uniref:hypothetical protein n=1 Tax=Streptomyces sp. LNU-CPARS28 TaxID=3137371 RepID=UPI00313470AE
MTRYVPPGRLSADQAATLLGITRGNLRILIHRGQLTRTGGTERHPQFDIEDVSTLYADRAARSGQPGAPVRRSRQAA